ncbi:MAG: hypothetical protein J5525_01975 [Lachnospiraceae bacterium]|nr:hypothetical protein [Lachnospiraceae bacterium]
MTLKNSFWARVKEDYKRRLWLWLTAVFMFMIFAPLLFLVFVASIDEASYMQIYGNMGPDMIKQAVTGTCEIMLGTNVFKLFLAGVFAVLAAFSGFYWLDDKVRVDFYASMPEKRNSMFAISLLGGIVMYISTSFVGMLLSHGILGAFGYGDCYPFYESLKSTGMCFLFFAGIYFVCILAITLTGNVFAAVCAIMVLSCYELLIRGIIIGYQSMQDYAYYMDTDFLPEFTPWGSFLRAFVEETYTGIVPDVSYFKIIVITAIFGALAYVAYIKRPMEATGKTLAFKKMSTPLKLLLAIPFTVLIGLAALAVAESVSTKYLAVVVIVLIISSIIIAAVIEAIFDLDVKSLLRKKLHWVITAIVAVAFFFVLRNDAFGTVRRLPDVDKVESVAVIPNSFMDSYLFMTEKLIPVDAVRYCKDNMYITDVEPVYELVKLSMEDYDSFKTQYTDTGFMNYNRYENYDDAVVIFRTKSGKTVIKNIPVPVESERAHELENEIFSSEQFTNGFFSIKNLDLSELISDQNHWNEFTNSFTSLEMTAEEMIKLIDCYKADLDDFDYDKICNEPIMGNVYYEINDRRGVLGSRYISSGYFGIYPSMERCVSYLKELGYETPDIEAEDINEIHITYNEYADVRYNTPEEYYNSYDSYTNEPKTIVYGDKEKIEKLLSCMTISEYDRKWGRGDYNDPAYEIAAQISTEKLYSSNSRMMMSTSMGHTTVYMSFTKGQVPDFVKEDLGIK